MRLLLKITVALSYLLMVGVNVLANALPINGVTSAQVSDSYPNLFAPAGIAFTIWGVIYLLLAGFTIYQFGSFKNNRVRILFSISSLVNMCWIFAWHYGVIWLSALLITTMLVLLISIARELTKEKFLVRLPFSVYFGWITVATIANITVLLVSLGWKGFGLSEELWTIIILCVGAVIGIATSIRNQDVAYLLVFIWAYFGIWYKHTTVAGFNGQYQGVIITTIICGVLFIATIGYLLYNAKHATQEKTLQDQN